MSPKDFDKLQTGARVRFIPDGSLGTVTRNPTYPTRAEIRWDDGQGMNIDSTNCTCDDGTSWLDDLAPVEQLVAV